MRTKMMSTHYTLKVKCPIPPFSNTDGRGSKKRTQTASETWAHAKKPKLGEEVWRDRFGNKIWAYSKCSWESGSLTSARNHLDLLQFIINKHVGRVSWTILYDSERQLYGSRYSPKVLRNKFWKRSNLPSYRHNISTPHSLRYTLPVMSGRQSTRRRPF